MSPDAQIVRAVYLAMDLTARFVIVPLCLASLLTGLVSSLGTSWGLFQHYWEPCHTVTIRTVRSGSFIM